MAKLLGPPIADLPDGTVLAEGNIKGRSVPWKMATINRRGGVIPKDDYQKYKSWQEIIASSSLNFRKVPGAYQGDVQIEVCFYMTKTRYATPDIDNLMKAFSDALQEVVIQNDVKVWKVHKERRCRKDIEVGKQRVWFRVVAMKEPTCDDDRVVIEKMGA